MNHQPDKLFREKFENFQRPVSTNAWSRVEARLDKKKDKGLLWKVAAAVIFLAVAGIVIWQWNLNKADSKLLTRKTNDTQNQSANPEKKTEKQSTPPSSIITPQEEKNELIVEKEKSDAKKLSPKKSEKQPKAKDQLIVPERTVAKVETETFEQLNEIEKTEESVFENPVTETQPVVVVAENTNEQKKEDTGVTLIYSVQEVDEKYLDKKALAEATSDEKKPSTLRKLWDKAGDLKNNQEAFGDLRQKKNEILALNFKGEKRSKN